MKYPTPRLTLLCSALAASALLVAACGGGGGGVETTTLSLNQVGNSPLVGVEMTATCANGTTGVAVVGTLAKPGEGSLVINGACTAPILLQATKAGQMLPLGATTPVAYDPAVNLPISTVMSAPPAAGESVTANPITTMVVNNILAGTDGKVNADKLKTVTVSNTVLVAAQQNVANALNMDLTDVQDAKGYANPAVAARSSLIAGLAAMASTQAATGTGAITNVGANIALEMAKTMSNVTTRKTDVNAVASSIVTAMPANVKPDVAAGAGLTTFNAIKDNSTSVFNAVTIVTGSANSADKTLTAMKPTAADLNKALTDSTNASVTEARTSNNKVSVSNASFVTSVKGVVDAGADETKKTAAKVTLDASKATAVSTANLPVFATPPQPLATTTTTKAPTTTTAAPTTTTAAATTTTAAATTTTAAATTTTAAATTTTAAATTTTAAATTTTAAATTTTTAVATTTTTTASAATTLPSVSFAATATSTAVNGVTGIGTNDGTAGATYTGAAIQIGPFTVAGLSAATAISSNSTALNAFTKFKVGSATAVASPTVSNGDAVTVVFDLAGYVADGGTLTYGSVIQPRIKAGNFTVTIGSAITMCADPSSPPPAGNTPCKK